MRTHLLPGVVIAIASAASGQVAYDYPTAVPPMGTCSVDFHQSTGVVGAIPATPPWDLSGIAMGPSTSSFVQWLPPSASPDAGSFPTATHLLRDAYNEMDEFVVVEPDGITLLGGVYSGFQAVLIDPFLFRVFPSMVGATYTDTMIAAPADTTVWNHTPTALGTLITPWATFTDVVRVERTRTIGTTTLPDHVFWYPVTNLLVPLAYLAVNLDVLTVLHPTGFTGTGESQEHSFMVYPTPTSDRVTVEWQGVPPRSIALVDAMGRYVYERPWDGMQRMTLELPAWLAPGTYHACIRSEHGEWRRPLVVLR